MTNNQFHSKFTDNVLSEIKSGKVKMRPKVHFLLKSALIILCVAVISLFVLYVVSLITFGMRMNGSWFAPEFGLRGVGVFLKAVPIYLLFISFILIGVLEILVRKFSFSHRMPILYSLLGVVIFVFVGGVIADRIGLHAHIFRTSQRSALPGVVRIYTSCCSQHLENAYRGIITELDESRLKLENPDGEFFEILLSSKTMFPTGSNFYIGDEIVVMGEKNGDVIQAIGMRKVGEDFGSPPLRFQKEIKYRETISHPKPLP